MPTPTPHDIAWFGSPAELRAWLAANHEREAELWVGMRPRASGLPTVSWEQIVDEVLCAGWIDGIRYSTDGGSCIRITPRRPGSIWSARNVARVEAMRAEGRMLPAGEAAFARRREDRTAVYSFESEGTLDAAAVEALRSAGGLAFFEAQSKTYRRTAANWVMLAKRPDTRAKRLGELVEASAAGSRLARFSPPSRRAAEGAA
jgi:uncharacterized protein YdeI (YjbR/CyaY-like superfamily)